MLKTDEKIPDGKKLLKTLVDLLAEQEGVEITYTIVERSKDEESN